jgi:hypothetical protein
MQESGKWKVKEGRKEEKKRKEKKDGCSKKRERCVGG